MNTAVDITQCIALVQKELDALHSFIQKNLKSDVLLVNELAHYIFSGKGKRLRPVTLLLTSKALNDELTPEHAITLGAVVEMIHTATLLHDDVVDESTQRRGKGTANNTFGNAAAVLVGDYLYSKAFQLMVGANNTQVMSILSNATNLIAEGEVMQLSNCGDAYITEKQYFDTIQAKTAILFQASAQIGCVIANQGDAVKNQMMRYGMYLGTAFQLADDILDYQADEKKMGKNVGDDLAEGKVTLPLIHALQHANTNEKKILHNAITEQNIAHLPAVLEIINQHKSLEYCQNKAQEFSEKSISALAIIPENQYKTALNNLAQFSVQRSF